MSELGLSLAIIVFLIAVMGGILTIFKGFKDQRETIDPVRHDSVE